VAHKLKPEKLRQFTLNYHYRFEGDELLQRLCPDYYSSILWRERSHTYIVCWALRWPRRFFQRL